MAQLTVNPEVPPGWCWVPPAELWDDPDPETRILGRKVACAVGACWMRKQVLGFSRRSAQSRSSACDAAVVGAGRPDTLEEWRARAVHWTASPFPRVSDRADWEVIAKALCSPRRTGVLWGVAPVCAQAVDVKDHTVECAILQGVANAEGVHTVFELGTESTGGFLGNPRFRRWSRAKGESVLRPTGLPS